MHNLFTVRFQLEQVKNTVLFLFIVQRMVSLSRAVVKRIYILNDI